MLFYTIGFTVLFQIGEKCKPSGVEITTLGTYLTGDTTLDVKTGWKTFGITASGT